MTKDFLLEIGCEELPARFVISLTEALKVNLEKCFETAGVGFQSAECYSTPRRMACLFRSVTEVQPPKAITRRGPAASAAFDQHNSPTLACIGFARSCGCDTDNLTIEETPKGPCVVYKGSTKAEPTIDRLSEWITEAVAALPLSKPMRWGVGDYSFLRPVRWVTARFGESVLDLELFGQQAVGHSYGHRFHMPGPVKISHVADYPTTLLNNGMVAVDPSARKVAIRQALIQGAKDMGEPLIDSALLDEVVSLVEWPVILRGYFDERFLSVPAPALIASMQKHQKCFPIVNKKGALQAAFLLVSNIDSDSPKVVIKGNERVIAARLADAAFFYEKDLKTPLEQLAPELSGVVFEHKLGSVADKVARVQKLATFIVGKLDLDKTLIKRSAQLCKCDLVSGLVGEFPDLQGVMGAHYAKKNKEPSSVVHAIEDHYKPRFSGDKLPTDVYATVLGIADRLDTLCGIIGIKKKPKADKDPFGLRRAALGVIRLIIECNLPLCCQTLIKKSVSIYGDVLSSDTVADDVLVFIFDRLKAWYLDQGVSPQVFQAVSASQTASLLDFSKRVQAVMAFQALPESDALCAANKRVVNILKKNKITGKGVVNEALLTETVEKNLVKQLAATQTGLSKALEKQNYTQALSELAQLKEPVDAFFTDVMIMSDDRAVRENRLALLVQLRRLFTAVADISAL